VVAPAPADLEVPTRVSLLAPAGRAEQRERALVARLNVRLEAVESELAECVPEYERHRFAHVAVAGVREECVVPEVGVTEGPAMDLRERVDTDERIFMIDDDGEGMTGRVHLDVGVERAGGVRRICPRMVQHTASGDRFEERSAVTVGQPTQRRPRPHGRGHHHASGV